MSLESLAWRRTVDFFYDHGQNGAMARTVLNNLTDDELAEFIALRDLPGAVQDRCVLCFQLLYERHAPALLAFLSARSPRSRRDDDFQTVWMKVWEKLPSSRTGHFRGWLFQVARNHLIDESRRKQADSLPESSELSERAGSQPVDDLVERERHDALRQCLDTLNERERGVITSLLSGDDYDLICQSQEIDRNAAFKATHAAKSKLIDCVERKMQ